MAPDKADVVLSWERPKTVTEVQSFLSFANFYRRFIEDYSRVARPLTELTKKSGKWVWNLEVEKEFEDLKKRFTTAPILAYFDPRRVMIIKMDASDVAIGALLSHRDEEGKVHPVGL